MCFALPLINSLKSKLLQLKQGMKESKLTSKELTANLFITSTVASAGADVSFCSLLLALWDSQDYQSFKSSLLLLLWFPQYSIICLAVCWSCTLPNRLARHSCPFHPPLPVCCTYPSSSSDGPQWMIWHTFGRSSPMPNACQMQTFQVDCKMTSQFCSFTDFAVTLVYISTSWYLDKFRKSGGSVKLGPSMLWNSS